MIIGVCKSELRAGTTYDVYAYTVGNNPTPIVGALYVQGFSSYPYYMYGYNQVIVNGTTYPFDIPLFSTTNFGPGMIQHIYKQTLTNLTPGSSYSMKFFTRSGYGPGYNYTPFGTPIGWYQQ